MDDCLDLLTVQVWVLVPYAPNEIGPNHAKSSLGRDLAGTGIAASLGFFLMASLWPTSADKPIDADSHSSAAAEQMLPAIRLIRVARSAIA
jgi:hypothetical protein